MGKQDTEKMLRIALGFLEQLTEKQFQELIDGKAVIRLEAKIKHRPHEDLLQKISKEAQNAEDIERILEGFTKNRLIQLCDSVNLNIKSRDTKKVIYQKIASYLQLDDSPELGDKAEIETNDWKQIEIALHTCMTLDEGKDLLMNQESLRLKKDIIAFAKSLGVYVNQKHTKRELLGRIVESLVGARIRGRIIRLEE